MSTTILSKSALGKKSAYEFHYNPEILFPVARQSKRDEIGVDSNNMPFAGYDCWNHYEVSWLNQKGKPLVYTAQIFYPCTTSHIIESKSLKLYFNSFNNHCFENSKQLEEIISQDLSKCINGEVIVKLYPLKNNSLLEMHSQLEGENIDDLDIECSAYTVMPEYLNADDALLVTEILNSDLLKSNCLFTNQPDWGSVQINYTGPKIDREGLLQYLVSFRNHNEFHEQCIERIFVDIMQFCNPSELTVIGRYTRRGGLDINPYRTNKQFIFKADSLTNPRLIRQ